ncbi:MAG: sugar phosphate isomerase/epimerase [Clostridia bacterium]|nr:sugar phosphate isomerase/epimerase [Clostridia bacterium]
MKLSVWSAYYIDLSPEDMVLEFEKYGYKHCEFSDEHSIVLMERGDPLEEGKRFRAFADRHGISFSQGHLLLRARLRDSEWISRLKNQLDLFRGMGVQRAVLHSDGMTDCPELSQEEIFQINVSALRELTDYIADTDMVICLENLTAPLNSYAEDLTALIDAVGDAHLGICLDTGHLNLKENADQKAFIQAAGKHLKALHLADNEGERDQHMMPFGKGKVNFFEVVTALKKIGYDGLYNLEIPGERKAPLPIRGMKLEYLKNVFAYLDQETNC